MNKQYWINWAKAAGIRAIKTAAQAAIGCIGAATAMGEVSWQLVASTAALAAVLSLITSVAGLPEVDSDGGDDSGASVEVA